MKLKLSPILFQPYDARKMNSCPYKNILYFTLNAIQKLIRV